MIDFQNVTMVYDAGNRALDSISLHIDDGEFVFLVGPSGSGKSTIIRLLTAELIPTSGSINVNGYQLERINVVGASAKQIKKRVPYVLDLVGLENRGRRYPNELSGGEQQRVAIARALVNNPAMIIADEPTGNLDPVRSYEIMMLLERINALGTTVMVVTHERELVNRFTKRVIAIDEGRVINDGMDGYYIHEEN